ncbi:MAG: FKBP-type peptidyl-prolyl cis-trans isomerase [Bacteroidales bacterium]|nr:FKBP-type peptidyl-prolyl cis-trans isomerase [Bacteroidales bacterium]
MRKNFFLLSALFLMLSVLTGCSNAPKGYQATDNGLYYRLFTNNGGENPQIGDLLELTMSCSVNDTVVILPLTKNIIPMAEPSFWSDFVEGFSMMHKGDSASFIVDIDSSFVNLFGYNTLPPQFSSTDIMRFEVRLDDFYPESEFRFRMIENIKKNYPAETEKAASELNAYLEKNGVVAQPTSTGLYYVKTQDGTGEKPSKGSTVKAHYTGYLLDGTVFDTSIERGEPIEFVLGVGQVIPGWDEGIALMSKGEKAVLYIPYYLAYGDRDLGVIPPFSNLVFEVELIDFK